MRNASNATTGRLYWTTRDSPAWDPAHMLEFDLVAHDAGFTEYEVPLKDVPGWSGLVAGLRVELVSPGQSIGGFCEMDQLSIVAPEPSCGPDHPGGG